MERRIVWAVYCKSWDGTHLEDTFEKEEWADNWAEELNKRESEKMDDFSGETLEYYVEELEY